MAIDPVTAGIDLVGGIINKIWPDKTEQEKAQLAAQMQIIQAQITAQSAQTDIDKAEAASPGMFAHWRAGLGWVCVLGFAVQFVIGPLGTWAAAVAGHPSPFPQMDMGTMMPLLLGMLGLGSMVTTDKIKGVSPSGIH